MNHYLEPAGFLGTGASLATDLTLVAYLLLIIPGMLAGWYFARRGRHRPHHKWTMTLITLINWGLIIGLMVVAYRYDVADNISSQPRNFRYLMPVVHMVFGLPAQLLATLIIINMFREDRAVAAAKARGETNLQQYWWKLARPMMRVAIVLWLITATFGVVSYLIRYHVLSMPSFAESREPIATEEVEFADDTEATEAIETTLEPETIEPTPVATEEIAPTDTEEPVPMNTEETSAETIDEPAVTEDVEPIATARPAEAPTNTPVAAGDTIPATTEEALDDDDSGQGRGRGRGRGGDDDNETDDD